MHLIDKNEEMNKFLADPGRLIPSAHLCSVCRWKEKGACRYIALTMKGCVCCKKTPVSAYLDNCTKEKSFTAVGDNCPGIGEDL